MIDFGVISLARECAEELRARGYQDSEPDPAQQRALVALQTCLEEWLAYLQRRRTRLRRLLVRPPIPRGLYLHGPAGRGKSLLMDVFFRSAPLKRKVRLHFHEFMRGVHERLTALQGQAEPLSVLADEVARRHRLICLDEFHVSDIADAMILARLLNALLDRRVSIMATSNQAPDDLYSGGLQRERFLPAIELIKSTLHIFNVDGQRDWRRAQHRASNAAQDAAAPASVANATTFRQRWQLYVGERYFSLSDAASDGALHSAFESLSQGAKDERAPLCPGGHWLGTRMRAGRIVWFDFRELCGKPRSQQDYLMLAERFDIFLISGIEVFTLTSETAAQRLQWLTDVLYDQHIGLIVTAAAEPDALFAAINRETIARSGVRAYDRTASRLLEMRSDTYWRSERTRRATALA